MSVKYRCHDLQGDAFFPSSVFFRKERQDEEEIRMARESAGRQVHPNENFSAQDDLSEKGSSDGEDNGRNEGQSVFEESARSASEGE